MSDRVLVWEGYRFCLVLRYFYWNLELFGQCGSFCLSFFIIFFPLYLEMYLIIIAMLILTCITLKIFRSPSWLGWPLRNICVTDDHGYVPLVVSTFRPFPHSWFVTGFVTRVTRRVPLVEQSLPTLPEHLSSLSVFREVSVTRSLVLSAMFCRSLFVICPFSFGHCFVCTSAYGFWLPLWYLQTILTSRLSATKIVTK